MARSMIVNFPPASNTVLYPTSVGGGGAGVIPLAIPYPVLFPDLTRQITLTSTDDLSAVNFTITGIDGYSNVISEVLVGPHGATVTSAYYYNTITSISASGAYTNFSIGYGSTAVSTWLSLNTMSPYPSYSIQATVYGTINYSVNQTLDAIQYFEPVANQYQFVYPQPVVLANDPLQTANASAVVTVTVPSTSALQTGDIVTIQGAAVTGGITAAHLNITAEITVASGTTFTYTAGGNGNGGAGGGTSVSYYYPAFPTSNAIVAALTGATSTQLYTSTSTANAVQLVVNSSTAPATLTLTLTQQGIN
jgi:hypothetical protein